MSNLMSAFRATLLEIPTFVTDETANAGKRRYKYLNLATLLKTIKPIFAKHGIGFTQMIEATGEKTGVVKTIIFDDEEEKNLGAYPFFLAGDPQANGSAVTYARRYALYAALGIYPDKDDDGQLSHAYAAYNAQNGHGGDIWAQENTPATPQDVTMIMEGAKMHKLPLGPFASQTLGKQVRGPQDLTKADIKILNKALADYGHTHQK